MQVQDAGGLQLRFMRQQLRLDSFFVDGALHHTSIVPDPASAL
jgi:hypothetical protein